MEILTPTTTVLTLACLALASAGDLSFKPPANSSTAAADASFKKVKTIATFAKAGAEMTVCPSGDCTVGQTIAVAFSRLEEVDASNTVVASIEKFNETESK